MSHILVFQPVNYPTKHHRQPPHRRHHREVKPHQRTFPANNKINMGLDTTTNECLVAVVVVVVQLLIITKQQQRKPSIMHSLNQHHFS